MQKIKDWNRVNYKDHIRNKYLWEHDETLSKIYKLYVTEAYSIEQIAKKLDMSWYMVSAIIEGMKTLYDVTLIGRIRRMIKGKLDYMEFTILGYERWKKKYMRKN